MKAISGNFFIAKVKIDRTQDDGLTKSVKEEYVCKAVNFTDCETKLHKEVGSADNVKGTFEVLTEAVAPFKEVYIFDEGETYYKVKIKTTYVDDYGKDKDSYSYYLVNASGFEQARKNIVEALGGTVTDWTISAVVEQKTIQVFE